MNPYGPSSDMFRTDANQSANSFSNPLSMSHLYPGWGVNPNYQTPAYDASYRPAYQGPNPYASYQKPGFMGALGQAAGIGKDPYWGNPVDNNRNAFNAIGGRPIDLAMHVGQNYIMPTAAFLLSNKLLSGPGAMAGRGLLGGLATGLGASGTGGLSMGARAIGGFAGGFLLPLGAGMAAADAMDGAVFQPYIRSRQMSSTVQDSFSGITFGGAGGGVISGRGLSGRESAGIGSQIDRGGIKDMTFSANQYHGIAAMGMNSGLFDDVGSSQITKRVASIASQIKMIVAISKDPNIQTAIEELGKLKVGGASIAGGAMSQAAGAYSAIGMQASAAGASVQRVMNTVGSQGQYMFQMNGITPYLGQISAATAFSGFASAQRAGIMSTAQFARMGGVEGATQSAMAAQMSGLQSPFSRMMQANRYLGGGGDSGVVGTVSAFGNLASKDPFAMQGAMGLYGGHMASRMAEEEGHMGLERRAIGNLQTIGRRPGANGKFSVNELSASLIGMGLTPEQTQSYVSLRASQTNGEVYDQQVKAFAAQENEQMRQTINQQGLSNSFANRNIFRPLSKFGKSINLAFADTFGYKGNGLVGSISDAVEQVSDWWNMGDSISNRDAGAVGLNMDNILKGASSDDKYNYKNYKDRNGVRKASQSLSDKYKVLDRLNSAAAGGGPGADVARKLLIEGFDSPNAKKLFADFIQSQPGSDFDKMNDSLDSSSKLFDDTAAAAKGNIFNRTSGTDDDRANLDSITGIKNSLFDNLRILGQAEDIFGAGGKLGLNLEDTLKNAKYSELSGALGTGNRVSKLRSIVDAGLKGGYGKSGFVAASMMTPEQASQDPSRFSDDPIIQRAIRDASGDRGKITRIMQGEIGRRSGGRIKGNGLNLLGTAEEQQGILATLRSAAGANSQAAMAARGGVDYSGFLTASNNIDRASNTFLSATKLFADSVASRPGFSLITLGGSNKKE